MLDEGGDDAFGVLVGNLDQHDVSRVALDQRRHIAVLGPTDEVALLNDPEQLDLRRRLAARGWRPHL